MALKLMIHCDVCQLVCFTCKNTNKLGENFSKAFVTNARNEAKREGWARRYIGGGRTFRGIDVCPHCSDQVKTFIQNIKKVKP